MRSLQSKLFFPFFTEALGQLRFALSAEYSQSPFLPLPEAFFLKKATFQKPKVCESHLWPHKPKVRVTKRSFVRSFF